MDCMAREPCWLNILYIIRRKEVFLSDRRRKSGEKVSCRIKYKSIPGQLHACNRQTSGPAEMRERLPAPLRPRACIFRVSGSNGLWSHETAQRTTTLFSVPAPTCNDLAFNFNFFLTKERKFGVASSAERHQYCRNLSPQPPPH